MSQSSAAPVAGVDYATPLPGQPPKRTLAAALILLGGLVLVVLGGCFLIGVMMTMQHIGFAGVVQQLPLTPAEVGFMIVLSVLALLSFSAAAVLLYLGTRALLCVVHA